MSDTNTNTNNDAINNKKNNNINGPDVGNFLLYYALGMLGIVLWVLFGTAWLYISKLVTSGIPIDIKYEPYSCDINPNLGKNLNDGKSVKVPMNSIHQLGLKGLAFWELWSQDAPANKWEQEATFETQEFLDSFNGTFIQEFRDSANIRGTGSAAATGFDKFCSIVLNNVAARGFKWYDTFSLSHKLNDSFKIFIYGLFGLILFPIIWVLNGMCSFYYLCKAAWKQENPDDLNDGGADNIIFSTKSLNQDESGWSLKYWPKRIGNGFIWFIYWFLIFPILTFFVCPLYATFMPFFKLLWSGSYSLKVDNKFYDSSEQSDTKSFWDFIKDTFAYKRTFLLFLSILNLFTCANTYLGEMYFGAVGLAVVLAIVFGDIFVNTAPNDNTMILQVNNNTPKATKLRRQPIHKGCMFPKEIKEIDNKLHDLNLELTSLIQQSQSFSNTDINNLISDLKTIRANLNNEFTAISMSDDKTKVDAFKKTVEEGEYESTITQLKAEIEKEKAAKEAAKENQKVIDEIKPILAEVYKTITEINTILQDNSTKLNTDKYKEYTRKNSGYKAEAVKITNSLNTSNNKDESNKLLADCKTLLQEVTTFKTELESEIDSFNAGSGSLGTGLNISAGSTATGLDTSTAAGSSSSSVPDTSSDTDTDTETDRPSITSNNYNVPDVDRDELITFVNNRKAQSVQGEQTENPMLSAGLGTPGGQLTPKDVTQENTVSTSNPRVPLNPSLPASVTQERTNESSSNNDVLNPMIEMTPRGIQGGQMKSMNVTQENTVPISNPVSKSAQLSSEEIKQRIAEGTDSSNTITNPILKSPNANTEQNISGSTSPGILSEGGRVLTLTFPDKTNTTLNIGNCIEFEKDGKQQSGKIVGFYKGNNSNTFVDVIFIDLWDESQDNYIPKVTKLENTNTNVLDYFTRQNKTNQDKLIFNNQKTVKPEGIALTPLYSGNNAYNDAGVWQTIKHCNAFSEPAQKIFYQNEKDNNQAISDVNAELDRQLAATTNNNRNNNNNNNLNNQGGVNNPEYNMSLTFKNPNNKGGGSKSKTLKKKQQNIKIRLV